MKYALNIVMVVAVALLATDNAAFAQYQLGDGRGLDNNLQQGSGGTNAPKVRNTAGIYADAVITGNVTGLGAFRGDIDYGAPSEFRDQLSTDDNFSFYRQSYGSAAPLRSRVLGPGNLFGNDLYGGGQSVLIRSGAGATLGGITGRGNDYSAVAPVTYSDGAPLSGYRTFGRTSNTLDQPDYYSEQRLAVSRDETGRLLEVTSSPLLGVNVRTVEPPKPVTTGELGNGMIEDRPGTGRLTGQLDVPVELTDDRGQPIQQMQLTARSVSLGERLGTQVLATRFLDQTQPTPTGAEELASVTKSLDALLGSASVEPGQDVYMDLLTDIRRDALKERTTPGLPGDVPPTPGDGESETEGETEAQPARPVPAAVAERNAVIEAALAKLDYDLEPLQSLAGASRTLFNDAMREAEAHMRHGRYFDAETAYSRALRLKSGYPTALIGRAHAQLGAGMFESAARSLRALFSSHPELIAARYKFPVFPDDDRLERLVTRLDAQRVTQAASTGPVMLRAYIAYQQRDARGLGEALYEMQKRDANDSLLPLFQRIWGDTEGAPADGVPSDAE